MQLTRRAIRLWQSFRVPPPVLQLALPLLTSDASDLGPSSSSLGFASEVQSSLDSASEVPSSLGSASDLVPPSLGFAPDLELSSLVELKVL